MICRRSAVIHAGTHPIGRQGRWPAQKKMTPHLAGLCALSNGVCRSLWYTSWCTTVLRAEGMGWQTKAACITLSLCCGEVTAWLPDENWLVSSCWGAWAEQNYTCRYASVCTAQPKHTGTLKDTFSQMSESAIQLQLSSSVRRYCLGMPQKMELGYLSQPQKCLGQVKSKKKI